MKVLIVSDSHGRNGRMELAVEQEMPLDLIIHLGDLEDGDDDPLQRAGCPVEIVRGNCDYFSLFPREKVIIVGGKRVFICHGHQYRVKEGTQWLAEAAAAKGCSVAMFGHTHQPCIEYRGGITLVNPGSISLPRQENRRPSYIIMEVDARGTDTYKLYYLSSGGI